jgi:hypothetical protein
MADSELGVSSKNGLATTQERDVRSTYAEENKIIPNPQKLEVSVEI